MKFSNVLKVFGAAALVAGLTPYRITRDEETGEKKVRALFWEATSGSKIEGEEKDRSVRLGFFSPVEQSDSDEPHFFADELTVEYTREDAAETPEEEEITEDAAADGDEPETEAAADTEDSEEAVEEDAAEEAAETPEKETNTENSEEL